jgi:hypothetical protein
MKKFKVFVLREFLEEYQFEAIDDNEAWEEWHNYNVYKEHGCNNSTVLEVQEI